MKDCLTRSSRSCVGLGIRLASLLLLVAVLSCFSPTRAMADPTDEMYVDSNKCVDEDLEEALTKSNLAAFAGDMAFVSGVRDDTIKAQAEAPKKESRGSVKDKYCIDNIYLSMDGLLKFLKTKIVGIIVDAILDLIQQILDAVCQVIRSSIDAVLEMVCLPLPDITKPKFSFSLDGLDSVSCDGLSLADFVQVQPAPYLDLGGKPLPDDLMSFPLSRGDSSNSIELFGSD